MLLTNLTIARFQRKIRKCSARFARNQLHMFSGTYCKKKRGEKAILSTTMENLVTPAPPTPRQGALYAKLQREKLHFLSLLTTILKALICWKLESFRGLCPLGPRQGLCPCTPPGALWRAPGPHPYEAHWFFRPPFFLQILDPPLYTSPLARPKSQLPPEASILGELGSSRPPPPPWNVFFWGGGGKHIVLPPPPPPPNNFVNLRKLIICNGRIGALQNH